MDGERHGEIVIHENSLNERLLDYIFSFVCALLVLLLSITSLFSLCYACAGCFDGLFFISNFFLI